MNKKTTYQIHLYSNTYIGSGYTEYKETLCISDFDIQYILTHVPNFLISHFKISICVFQDDFSEKVLSETEFASHAELAVYLTKIEMAKKAFDLIGLKVVTKEDKEHRELEENFEALKEKETKDV